MSERMTSIRPKGRVTVGRGAVSGTAAYGRHSRAEMIADYRAYYRWQADEAAAALAVVDDDLIVETYTGFYARRNVEEVTE